MIKRHIIPYFQEVLKDTPVILLSGARQCGKSTLAKWLIDNGHPATYITLDDTGYLSAAISDPQGFIESIDGNLVIDEVQKASGLFSAIKIQVDRKRIPGKFILTGSANSMMLPKISETLAGRMELLTLHTLSEAEISGLPYPTSFSFFSSPEFFTKQEGAKFKEDNDIFVRLMRGGYPEIVTRTEPERMDAWFNSYITTVIHREIRDISNISGLIELPRLLSLLASRLGGILNIADVSRNFNLPYTTLNRYLSLLQATFLIDLLPAYSAILGRRLVKAPKIFFRDIGLASYLVNFNPDNKGLFGRHGGPLFENFIIMEIIKQISSRSLPVKFLYLRTSDGKEIDMIMEDKSGKHVCIEIKSSRNVISDDFKHIKWYADENKKNFMQGFVIYTGNEVIPFGKNLFALPANFLWT